VAGTMTSVLEAEIKASDSWNCQVADRQADGQSKLRTLSTNELYFPAVASSEADLKVVSSRDMYD